MNVLTGTYRDLAKNRLTILSVDYNFKEGMVSESVVLCMSVCIVLIVVFIAYLSGCPKICFSTLSVLDCRSIFVNMIDIKLSKSLLTTVMCLLPFSLQSVVLVNLKASPLTG